MKLRLSHHLPLVLALACCSGALAEAPFVGYVFPPGGKAGTTVEVKLGGYDWTPDIQFFVHDPRVKLEVAGPPGEVLMHDPPYWFGIKSFANDPPLPREVSAKFVLPADLPPGPIRWRVANATGASNCGVFIVSNDNEVIENETRKQPQELAAVPVTVSGRLRRIEEVDVYRFKSPRAGPVTCDLMARRLGSDFHGVLEVRDAGGKQIAEVVDSEGLDPALTFFAEKDQSYTIAVRDIDYRGFRSLTYRLSITPGPRVLAAIPAAGKRGETRAVEFVGIGVATGQAKLESVTKQVTFPATPGLAAVPYRLETAMGTALPFTLLVSDLPESIEPATVDLKARALAVPSAVTGVLTENELKDVYTFAGKKGEIISLTAEARRLGSPLDLSLAVVGPDGKELASADDAPGTIDPSLSLTLPVDGVYQVAVSDVSGTKHTRASVYRLVVDRQPSNFRLETAVPLLNIPIGGPGSLVVNIIREGGFKEPVAITLSGLPPGVTAPPNLVIPPTANTLAIALTAAKDAPAAASLVQITGSAKIGDKMVTQTARVPAAGNLAPRSPEESRVSAVLVATTITPPPFKVVCVEADGGRRIERGTTHLAELTIERKPGFAGEIILDMAGTQSRHRQGMRGPSFPVAPTVGKVAYPVFLPEWMETTRTSRIALVALAKVPDGRGTLRYVLAPMGGQITISIEGALLKLSHSVDELRVQPGQPVVVPLKVARSTKLTEPVRLELIVPEELAGLVTAEPVVALPTQESVAWKLTTKADARLVGSWKLTARATAMRNNHPVVSESVFEVEFVAAPLKAPGK